MLLHWFNVWSVSCCSSFRGIRALGWTFVVESVMSTKQWIQDPRGDSIGFFVPLTAPPRERESTQTFTSIIYLANRTWSENMTQLFHVQAALAAELLVVRYGLVADLRLLVQRSRRYKWGWIAKGFIGPTQLGTLLCFWLLCCPMPNLSLSGWVAGW